MKLQGVHKKRLWYVALVGLAVLITLDLYNAVALNNSKSYQLLYPVSQVKREPPTEETTVAVVRTNTPGVPNPVDPDKLGKAITTQQVENLVRHAVALIGGMDKVVKPDDKLVLIKPNWVVADRSGSGSITDQRVVRAVVKLVYEANPNAEIVVADGPGGWIDSSYAAQYKHNARVVDGLTLNGYKAMVNELLNDPTMPGLKLRLGDLNVPIVDTVQVKVPNGGWYQDTYWTHKLVRDADVLIQVPVMKVHGTRITGGLKNNIGIGPGSRYGWSKNGLDHNPAVIDKVIVDLAAISGTDLIVVDAITALEKAYTTANGSPLYRNMIIAGHDIVAVDTVMARLMGFNPEDISHVQMAALSGLGIGDLERINIVGETIESAAYLFQKNIMHQDWLGRSKEGQSNRFWTMYLSKTEINPTIVPTPGKDGWTEVLYASDDFIDISKAFPGQLGNYYYAFTKFSVEESQKAELRVGSSTHIKVWIDGKLVHSYGALIRKHVMPNDVIPITLEKGEHTLLVQIGNGTFNLTIAEPVPDVVPQAQYRDRYAGTRVHGLKFFL